MASGLLALTAASCREAPGFGWNSIVTSTASETFLLRYVPAPGLYDDAGPQYVFEIPAGARGVGLSYGGWHGTLEVLRPDCSVVGSMDLGGSHAETFVEEGGRPRAATGADDLPSTEAHLRPVGETCGSPPSYEPGPSS
jgi:hypothetical protein